MELPHQILQNNTAVTEFILLGLSSNPKVQYILFGVFLLIYLVALSGNVLILLTISLDSKLHSPMYFFLGNLSVVDIGYTSSIVPKMLMNYLTQDKTISLPACFSQMYFFISFGSTECLILGVMAYDRYAAICHPLHYSVLMNRKVCASLAATAWFLGMANSGMHACLMSLLSFCRDNVIPHFFCDIPPLWRLSCTSTLVNQIAVLMGGGSVIVGSLLCTLVSYVYIVTSILKIRTKDGRLKAFSTCASHLIVVSIFYSTAIITYLLPSSASTQIKDQVLSVLYGILAPMLNPIIYSLRNRDVKNALQKELIGCNIKNCFSGLK